ncbi:MAG: hypothetical protein ABI479_12580 [Gallionella sp.]
MTTKKKVKASAKKSPVEKTTAPAKRLKKPAVNTMVKDTPRPAAKKQKKESKKKVVRDSFTMPQSEYQKIAEIKAFCLKAGMHVKKSEVLRAGLKALAELNATQVKRALSELEKIKTGRPKKH